MLKQEQIKEIENMIDSYLQGVIDGNELTLAGMIYNKILPEDSVVLSAEEYEMLVNQYKNLEIKYSNLCDNYRLCKDANETLKQNIIITRKEAVEKFAKDLLSVWDILEKWSEKYYEPHSGITPAHIKEYAKQFGVEIKGYKND